MKIHFAKTPWTCNGSAPIAPKPFTAEHLSHAVVLVTIPTTTCALGVIINYDIILLKLVQTADPKSAPFAPIIENDGSNKMKLYAKCVMT